MTDEQSHEIMCRRQRAIPHDLPSKEYERRFYAEVDAHLSRTHRHVPHDDTEENDYKVCVKRWSDAVDKQFARLKRLYELQQLSDFAGDGI